MSKVVFVLGAGASVKAGAPTMASFFDAAENVLATGRAGGHASRFESVFRGIAELQRVYAKAQLDSENLEAVFGAFEMARLLSRLGDIPQTEIGLLSSSIRRVIARTLEQELRFPVEKGRLEPPPPYRRFVDELRRIRKEAGQNSVAVITFNYDLALDYAFQKYVSAPINYGLPGAESGTPELLKLHGSLNWVRCACGSVVVWQLGDYLKGLDWSLNAEGYGLLDVTERLARVPGHCDQKMGDEPFVVPPTWSKGEYHAQISPVWMRAAAHLSEAESIFVIGYSLPDNDEFFRYLFALGSVGKVRPKHLWVVNPDPEVESRFTRLLGPVMKTRFRYCPWTFESALGNLPL